MIKPSFVSISRATTQRLRFTATQLPSGCEQAEVGLVDCTIAPGTDLSFPLSFNPGSATFPAYSCTATTWAIEGGPPSADPAAYNTAIELQSTGGSPACTRTDSNLATINDYYSGTISDYYAYEPDFVANYYECVGPDASCSGSPQGPIDVLSVSVTIDTSLGLSCPVNSYIFAPMAEAVTGFSLDPIDIAALQATETGSVPTTTGGQPVNLGGFNIVQNGAYGPIQWTPDPSNPNIPANCAASNAMALGNARLSIACAFNVINDAITYLSTSHGSFVSGVTLDHIVEYFNGGPNEVNNPNISYKRAWPDGNQNYDTTYERLLTFVKQDLKDCK